MTVVPLKPDFTTSAAEKLGLVWAWTSPLTLYLIAAVSNFICSPSAETDEGIQPRIPKANSEFSSECLQRMQSCCLPLSLEMVQLRRTLAGKDGSSKTKGPTLGSASASEAVMLTLELGRALSHTWASRGTSTGALSLTSIRMICRVPVPLAWGEPDGEGGRGDKTTRS